MKLFEHKTGQRLETNGAKIYYELLEKKSAPTLVLLHGGMGNIEDFNALPEYLKDIFQIIGIDSRGQGASTLGKSSVTYAQLQKDAEAVLEHLKLTAVHILGFSDGGTVGYRMAAEKTIGVKSLVAVSAHWHLKNLEPARPIYEKITGESWRKKFPEMYASYQRQNPEPDYDRLAKSMVAMWLDGSTDGAPQENIRKISCPTLIVRGDQDRLLPRSAAVDAADRIENAQLLSIPFSDHVVFEDQKEVFSLGLRHFVRSILAD